MDQRGESLRLGEAQHIETALVPKPADAPVTPRKQRRLYDFVGIKGPDAKILDAIAALPEGARPTKEMFAFWGRQGVFFKKKKNRLVASH